MIHADTLRAAGIDYDAGLERFMGDPELYEMVLASFARSDMARRARAAYDANDRDALLKVVHEAKGSSGNAGLDRLYAEASELVKLLRSHDYAEAEYTERYLGFEALYGAVRAAIEAAIGPRGDAP